MSVYFGKETLKLGFGLMRLPKKGLHTDIEQVKKMVENLNFHCTRADFLCRLWSEYYSKGANRTNGKI